MYIPCIFADIAFSEISSCCVVEGLLRRAHLYSHLCSPLSLSLPLYVKFNMCSPINILKNNHDISRLTEI